MKKILLNVMAIFIATSAFAQVDTTGKKMFPPDFDTVSDGMHKKNYQDRNLDNHPDTMTIQKSSVKYPDGIMMKDGKMWMVKDSKLSLLDHNMTMSNGTKVFSDGSYSGKNGAKMMLKEGEFIDMSGKVIPLK